MSSENNEKRSVKKESKISGVPKNFIIRCHKCRWGRITTGLSEDVADLFEYKQCATCGKWRKFRCPKCGGDALMKRIKRAPSG